MDERPSVFLGLLHIFWDELGSSTDWECVCQGDRKSVV